ncbi:hypothetical protein IV500_04960 [Paeniglutamicibacter antarcticus]|uniref:Uncharacterized protein n=1 Tax=Arthrobacter terrae TaxID=2935737 RepID=A0A931CI64_9MICC|nr:hypothetical protein [Arthrobacter terrae]MBG0738768.1 hypothetical protein [Arthrobacter terrae]
MTVVISFPTKTAATPRTSAYEVTDEVLHELLRKAVVAYRAGEARTPGSLAHRHHFAVSVALLDAIQVIMGFGGVAQELERCLGSGITDIRALARVARAYNGPESA